MLWNFSDLLVVLGIIALIAVLAATRRRWAGALPSLGQLGFRSRGEPVGNSPGARPGEPAEETPRGSAAGDDLLDELRQLNGQVSQLHDLISGYRAEAQRERRILIEGFSRLLQLQDTQSRSWADSVALLHKQLAVLNNIASSRETEPPDARVRVRPVHDAETRPAPAPVPNERVESFRVPPPEQVLDMTRTGSGTAGAQEAALLEKFVAENIEKINKAAYDGVGGIQSLVAGAGIEVHEPSNVVFILSRQGGRADYSGKAFALPGQLLGRPWSEWFSAEKELVYPVESTLQPASVRRKEDGGWEVCEKGRVSQR